MGSYTSAILAHSPEVFLQISRLSASLAISILAAQFPALYKLIQRSTRIAVFDSLLPGRGTSLRLSLEGIACDSSVVGAMIELQIHSLEGNLYKSEALETISALLEELLELYTPEVYPVRRSRCVHGFFGSKPLLMPNVCEIEFSSEGCNINALLAILFKIFL